jgi:hypothetical protein
MTETLNGFARRCGNLRTTEDDRYIGERKREPTAVVRIDQLTGLTIHQLGMGVHHSAAESTSQCGAEQQEGREGT